jgi:hypothetical protein
MSETITYKSLYEYLGRPAGGELGKEVWLAAKAAGVQADSHEVSTPKYTGIILKYPISFLDEYFKKTNQTVQEILDDDLPF